MSETFWNKVERKTGMVADMTDDEILQQICDEWGEDSMYLIHRRWKLVNHLGKGNFMPYGGGGKSLGVAVLGLLQ